MPADVTPRCFHQQDFATGRRREFNRGTAHDSAGTAIADTPDVLGQRCRAGIEGTFMWLMEEVGEYPTLLEQEEAALPLALEEVFEQFLCLHP